jgi:P27 family predicted phage terminase small subunit
MGRGRKAKPTALKVLEGNPGKRKINRKEPRPGKARVGVPAEFLVTRALSQADAKGFQPPMAGEEAAKAFRRLKGELEKLNLLTVIDIELLSAYCQAYGFWKEASAQVNKLGMIITTPNGNFVQNPFLAIVNKQALMMAKIASEFGFSPSSRSRLEVPDGGSKDDPLEQLLAGRAARQKTS